MKDNLKHVELFSGIGAFTKTTDKLKKDFDLSITTIAYSEINKFAKKTYNIIHDTKGVLDMGDIVAWNETNDDITRQLDIDVLSAGFPCQTFSYAGKGAGFEDPRGLMFFQIVHILKVKLEQGKPIPFLLLENVKGLLTHDKGKTFKVIKETIEQLGYHFYYDIFSASDFKLAQNRNRIIIFATIHKLPCDFEFSMKRIKDVFDANYSKTWSIETQNKVLDILDKHVDPKYHLPQSNTYRDYIFGVGSKYGSTPVFDREIASTIICSHDKRACMDNYYSIDYITNGGKEGWIKPTINEYRNKKLRKLTPREEFALQRFDKEDADKASNSGISNTQLYKQIGNSYAVNMFYAILYYLFINQKIQLLK